MQPLPAEVAAEKAEKLVARFEAAYLAFAQTPQFPPFTTAEDERVHTAIYRKLRGKYLAARRALLKAIAAG